MIFLARAWLPELDRSLPFERILEDPKMSNFPANESPNCFAFDGSGTEVAMIGTGPERSSNGFFSGGIFLSVQLDRARDSLDEKINSCDKKGEPD